jgi:hypothetical protein
MKKNWIALKRGSLLSFIMAAVLVLTTMSCEKDYPTPAPDRPNIEAENAYDGNVLSQSFWVGPEAALLNLMDGAVTLNFPEGTVAELTELTLYSFPVHQADLDDHNMYLRGYSLVGIPQNRKFANVTMQVNFDMNPESWLKGAPVNPKNLTIYYLSPTLYSYTRISSVGDCCIDCSCNTIKGCIRYCGFYVVGEN